MPVFVYISQLNRVNLRRPCIPYPNPFTPSTLTIWARLYVKTKAGNTHLLVVVDAFTKFILLYPVKSTKTKLTIKSLRDMIKTFGVPHRIVSDMGTSFTSEKFKAIHYLTAVSMPHRSGQVERYNQAILSSAMSNLVISKARTAPIVVFMFHGMKSASELHVAKLGIDCFFVTFF
jgi:hypothetical protein